MTGQSGQPNAGIPALRRWVDAPSPSGVPAARRTLGAHQRLTVTTHGDMGPLGDAVVSLASAALGLTVSWTAADSTTDHRDIGGADVVVSIGAEHAVTDDELAAASGIDPRAQASLTDERYRLEIPASGPVVVSAATAEGAFRAVVALLRTLAASTASSGAAPSPMDGAPASGGVGTVAIGSAVDGPAFSWRGLSLDTVRHFFSVAEVERVIDLLAWHAMSVLHLHLTDVQGWRIQLACRPDLTPQGADFYSSEDLAHLVEYAQARAVTIVPEIDLPGHVAAAVALLPELAGDRPSPHPYLTYLDPRLPAVQEFTREVIAELAGVSPSPYVHIGGDEAFGMPAELYADYVRDAVTQVRAAGKRPLGWQEGARSGAFGPDDALQVWISAEDAFDLDKAKEQTPEQMHPFLEEVAETFALAPLDAGQAAAAGVPLIASPSAAVYLDRKYADPSNDTAQNTRMEAVGFPSYTPQPALASAQWDPSAAPEIVASNGTVAGVEAAIWAETITTFDDLAMLLLPRLALLAERMWWSSEFPQTTPEVDYLDDLAGRLAGQAGPWAGLGFDQYYAAVSIFGQREFPRGFLVGASGSAHQIEGNNVASDWWQWETMDGSPLAEASGDACDSFHHWREDMEALAAAGCNAYRFSIEWARVEPADGRFSAASVQHYVRMVEYATQLGLEPVVTLHHFTNPAWFSASGGWTRADATERFVRYVDAVAPVIDAGVRYVVTINEPNMVAVMATVRAGHGSFDNGLGGGLPAPDHATGLALAAAHHGAVARLHHNHPGVLAGWSVANQAVQAAAGGEERADAYREAIEDWFLREARSDDFVGVQAYTRSVFGPDGLIDAAPDAPRTLTGWEYYPPALAEAVQHTVEVVGADVPILVTENGIATGDDGQRVAYTRDALAGLARAMKDGADVRGYLHWSVLDNYEWGHFAPTFGLIAVDGSTFERLPKPSLAWLGAIARRGTVR